MRKNESQRDAYKQRVQMHIAVMVLSLYRMVDTVHVQCSDELSQRSFEFRWKWNIGVIERGGSIEGNFNWVKPDSGGDIKI